MPSVPAMRARRHIFARIVRRRSKTKLQTSALGVQVKMARNHCRICLNWWCVDWLRCARKSKDAVEFLCLVPSGDTLHALESLPKQTYLSMARHNLKFYKKSSYPIIKNQAMATPAQAYSCASIVIYCGKSFGNVCALTCMGTADSNAFVLLRLPTILQNRLAGVGELAAQSEL